jgi:hypothetical protein
MRGFGLVRADTAGTLGQVGDARGECVERMFESAYAHPWVETAARAPETLLPSMPRILRVIPRGPVTRPEHPIPVMVCIRWHDGRDTDVPAIATAWTREAVEVSWNSPAHGMRSDWVPAGDVRRNPHKPPAPPPPSSRGRSGRPRW